MSSNVEGSEAAFVFAEGDAVDPDGGGGHGAFEVDEDAVAFCGGGRFEAAAIGGDELVDLVVEAVPGQLDVGVGNDDGFEGGVVEGGEVCAFYLRWVVAPAAVDRQDGAALRGGLGCECWNGGECRGGEEGAGRFEEVASAHSVF